LNFRDNRVVPRKRGRKRPEMSKTAEWIPIIYTLWTLDEVAECLPVSPEMSSKLWGMLPEGTPNEVHEDNPYGSRYPGEEAPEAWTVAGHWDKFTAEEKVHLVAVAKADSEEG